jgi:hypothetical protein
VLYTLKLAVGPSAPVTAWSKLNRAMSHGETPPLSTQLELETFDWNDPEMSVGENDDV